MNDAADPEPYPPRPLATMDAPTWVFPEPTRLRLFLEARRWDVASLMIVADLPLVRVRRVLAGPTPDPHLIAARLGLPVATVVRIRAVASGSGETYPALPWVTIQAVLDGAPPPVADVATCARALAVPFAATNPRYCPRCQAGDARVRAAICLACGWRPGLPWVPLAGAAQEVA